MSQRQIEKQTKRAWTTVRRWVSRFEEAKAARTPAHLAVLDKPHSGAPPKITPSIGKAIIAFTERRPNRPTPAIRLHIQNEFGVILTTRRISQWLGEQGLRSYAREKRPRLLQQHKRKRVAFARAHLRSNTLFTDETEFLLNPASSNTRDNRVWARRKIDVPPAEVAQFSSKVQVWGGISEQGKTRLIFYEGGLGNEKYVNSILQKAKPDFTAIFGLHNKSWTFVHDGASAHKGLVRTIGSVTMCRITSQAVQRVTGQQTPQILTLLSRYGV